MLNKKSYALSRLRIQGNSSEIGLKLGRFGTKAVHEHLLKSTAWATVQNWKNSTAANQMIELTKKHFPDIWSELNGLAQGLELPIEDVFLWNARGDLWAMAPDGCTTVMIPGSSMQRITHNEDGDPMFAGLCAIAQFDVTQGCSFASFVYPGSLPGHTLAVNSNGLAMTVNNIRALTVQAGLPRMVITRAILNAKNASDAVQMLRSLPLAGAFHLNLSDTSSQQLLSVEYSSNYVSAQIIQQPYLHANHATHPSTRNWPQIITGTSGRRQIRGNELLKQTPLEPLKILADNDNSGYPIYRRSLNDSDNENTLATADIHVKKDHIQWEVYEDPNLPASIKLKNAQFVE